MEPILNKRVTFSINNYIDTQINNVWNFYFQITNLMRDKAELKELLDEKERTIMKLQEEAKKRKKRPLNKNCSKAVHQITKKLKKEQSVEFDFNVSASDPHNSQVMNRVVEGAMRSKDCNTFTKEEAEEATQRYFSNLKDEHKRQLNGKREQHLKCMRRNSRKDAKLRMRVSGLKSKFCPLTPVQKLKAKEILHGDYMSSDDDEVDKAEDGTESRNVRIIPWESDEAKHIKSVLLDTHIQHVLGDRDRKKMQKLRRDDNCSLSERKCPNDAPVWACIF